MAAILSKSVYFHIGRTGGYSVRDALEKLDLVQGEVGSFHASPLDIAREASFSPNLFRFCFVRHPLAWIRSVWLHDVRDRPHDGIFGELIFQDSFEFFLEQLTDIYKDGVATTLLSPYTENCDFVGKVEELPLSLGEALLRAGEKFNSEIIENISVTNTSKSRFDFLARAPRPLWCKLLKSERAFCDRFSYDGIPEHFVDENCPKVSSFFAPLVQDPCRLSGDVPMPTGLAENLSLLDEEQLRKEFDAGHQTASVEKELHRRLSGHRLINIPLTPRLDIGGSHTLKDSHDFLAYFGDDDWRASRVAVISGAGDLTGLILCSLGADVVMNEQKTDNEKIDLLCRFARISPRLVPISQMQNLAKEQGLFDVVVCVNALHEAFDPFGLLLMISKIIRDGGKLIIACVAFLAESNTPLCYLPACNQGPLEGIQRIFSYEALKGVLASVGFVEISPDMIEPIGFTGEAKIRLAEHFSLGSDGRKSPISRLLLTARHCGENAVSECFAKATSHYDELFKKDIEEVAVDLTEKITMLENALADRENDLAWTRNELKMRGIEVDEARAEIVRLKEGSKLNS